MASSNTESIDYDGLWKMVITRFFKEFVHFFLPELYPLIDFSKGVEFLEQEFLKIIKEAGKDGKSYKDKLVKVFLYNGKERWILIHIEVQSSRDIFLPGRMFKYYSRIVDKHKCDVTAIAIYSHDDVPKVYDHYRKEFHGTEVFFKFNARIVKEYPKTELLASDNPFALVVLASQYLNESMSDDEKRLTFKKKLISLLTTKGYSPSESIQLLIFIKFLLKLPIEQEIEFEDYIKKEPTMEMPEYAMNYAKEYTENLNKKYFGESLEDLKAAKEMEAAKRIKAEAKQRQAESQRRQEEKQRRQAEAQQKQAESQRRQEEMQRKQAEIKLTNTILNLAARGLKPEDIAQITNTPLNVINGIIENR